MAIQAQLCSENLGFALGNPQDLMMENACGFNHFSFNPPQQPEKLQQLSQHMQSRQQLQNLDQSSRIAYHDNSALLQKNNINAHQLTPFSQSLTTLIEKQKLEIDSFISLQNERLRWALQEQRRQQLGLILKKYETKTQFLLKQKDEEITKAASRTMELKDFLKRMEIEKQTWQRLAKEKEVMVLSLNNTIEQLRESGCLSANGGVEDAESCCDIVDNRGGNEPVEQQQNGEQITRTMICKGCNSRCSCIIVIPCRHMCLCKACDAFFASCPLCGIQKKAIIEALI